MKPPSFKYFDPDHVDGALDLLGEHGDDAKLLAGGQSLIPLMNFRMARPQVLIDLNRIEELNYLREVDGQLAIGAMTRQRTLEDSALIRTKWGILTDTMELIGHPQIRNRGTVGGSLVHADPAAELTATALPLDAEMTVRSRNGERVRTALRTALKSRLSQGLSQERQSLYGFHLTRCDVVVQRVFARLGMGILRSERANWQRVKPGESPSEH